MIALLLYSISLPPALASLANVYVKTVNEAKRGILRLLEGPVGLMGMDSPQLLALVHNTPKGSETLITRIIHILTEKGKGSSLGSYTSSQRKVRTHYWDHVLNNTHQ